MKNFLLLADNRQLDTQELPLEFANTADWHASEQPVESLNNYTDLLTWAQQHGLLLENNLHRLAQQAESQPGMAKATLVQAISLREAIYRIFSATSAGRSPQPADLATLNSTLREAFKHLQVVQGNAVFRFQLSDGEDRLDQLLWPLAYAAAELLTSSDLDRVKECEDDRGCGFLFFDTSKNRSRRWCSMRGCGNRAKVRRHRRQKRAEE